MYLMETKSLVDGDTYCVWHDYFFDGEVGIFVLHMQGNIRKLVPMARYLRSLDVPIFFVEGMEGVWINHREEVTPGLFKVKWNNTKII